MLADSFRELLTAYVDGELSGRQRRAVQKLLHRSPEARALLRRLQEDSSSLIELPPAPPALPPDFAQSILRTISERGLRPGQGERLQFPPAARAVSPWTVFAAAAAVIALAAGATYFFVKGLNDAPGKERTAHKKPQRDVKPQDQDPGGKENKPPLPPENTPRVVKQPEDMPRHEAPAPMKEKDPPPHEVVNKPDDRKPDPEEPPKKPDPRPEPEPESIVTAPTVESFQPSSAEVALPHIIKLRDLQQEKTREGLLNELQRQNSFYVELLCREATHAFPRLQETFKAQGFEVLADSAVQARLKLPQNKTTYLVYLDDVTAAELLRLLTPLGNDEKPDAKKPGLAQFMANEANLIVSPMNGEQRKKMVQCLGLDPRQVNKVPGPLGVDLSRPLAEQTAESLGVDKKSSTSARAVATTYLPLPPRVPSPEVKRFLDERSTPRKGTLQVVLVLRSRPQ